ncbi:hypothetical protein [Falsigemmobacter faecalis]|uniref:hypothetical protein n=1 Tax=Falsigemmobacter faecalis TaxID=2488730 RepID=UPI0013155615|nr:hypothetical protein [Falsigemmobacter faecalis]
MTTFDSDLLRQIIADETESLAQKRQGKFCPATTISCGRCPPGRLPCSVRQSMRMSSVI